jgi:hypothetical protein
MAKDDKLYEDTGQVGAASQYTIPMKKLEPMTPFIVPGSPQKAPDKKDYTPDRTRVLKGLEKDFREYYNKTIEGRLTGILGKGSEDEAKPINEALLGFAKDKAIDPEEVYILAEKTKLGIWGPLSKNIKNKLEEKFDLNAPDSEEAKKGTYLSPKKSDSYQAKNP